MGPLGPSGIRQKIKERDMEKGKFISASLHGIGALALFAFADSALAKDFAEVAGSIHSQFQSAADLISGGAYLGGAGMGAQAALKFRDHNENPHQTRLSKPLTYAAVAGALLGLPSFLTVGADSAGLEAKNSLHSSVLGERL